MGLAVPYGWSVPRPYGVALNGCEVTRPGSATRVSPRWDREAAAETIRDQIRERARELDCVTGSGNLDLPGSSNWCVLDIALVPTAVAKGAGPLLPADALRVVEVTSESNVDTGRVVKRRR